MNQLIKYTTIFSAAIIFVACGGSAKKEAAVITEKKVELEKKEKQYTDLGAEIQKLKEELAKLDTGSAKQSSALLVSVTPLTTGRFEHFIELQGKVDPTNVSTATPKYGPGQVRAVFVTQGQQVSKGQTLLKLDDILIQQQIATARSGLSTLQAQLNTAKDIYNRQNNLWKQGIGTEVQLIQARTTVETLETQLATSRENIKTLERQLDGTNVRAEVSGVADVVNVRAGELFVGSPTQIVIVNTNNLKAIVMVPETYASKVKVGAPVKVILPDINKTVDSRISVSGKLIDVNSRSFSAEAKLPYDALIRPNQIANFKIQDYAVENTIAIPVNTVQTDEKGKYVFVAVQEGGRTVARKKPVGVGELNGAMIEAKVGLSAGDQLITAGYQNLYEGQVISIVK